MKASAGQTKAKRRSIAQRQTSGHRKTVREAKTTNTKTHGLTISDCLYNEQVVRQELPAENTIG